MKIRITGTALECSEARNYYLSLRKMTGIKTVEVSSFYPNRGSSQLLRLYVDIEYTDDYFSKYKEIEKLNNKQRG